MIVTVNIHLTLMWQALSQGFSDVHHDHNWNVFVK